MISANSELTSPWCAFNRAAGTLTAKAWHPEGRFRSTEPLERALGRLARQLGLTPVVT